MGSGEKQRRIKATLEVIELIENAVAYVTTHRFTTRPFQRGRVRDAVADILGIGSATVARVESGALKRNPAQPAEKRAAKKSRHGPPPLEQVAKRIKVGDDAGWDIVDAWRDIIAEVNRRDPPQEFGRGMENYYPPKYECIPQIRSGTRDPRRPLLLYCTPCP
jgi:hypothetical protein